MINHLDSISKRTWTNEVLCRQDFQTAFYNATLSELKSVAFYVRLKCISKDVFKEIRNFYLENSNQ